MKDQAALIEEYWKGVNEHFAKMIERGVEEAKAALIADGLTDEDFARWVAERIVEAELNRIAFEQWAGPIHLLSEEDRAKVLAAGAE